MLISELPGARPEGFGYQIIDNSDLTWARDKDDFALKIVLQDTSLAEQWLQSKLMLTEWLNFERLYLFQVPVAFWDGTNIPRSHLGMPLVLEHLESILPQAMLGLFSDEPPFESNPRPRTSMDAARANDSLIRWELDESGFREQMRLGVKGSLLFGTGIWKWGWRQEKRKLQRLVSRAKSVNLPTGANTTINITTGDIDDVKRIEDEQVVALPFLEHINLRHILVDPATRSGDIRKAKYVVHRLYLSAEQLQDLRDVEGYKNIPTKSQLQSIFMPQPKSELAYGSQIEGYGLNYGWNREWKATPRPQDTTFDPLRQPLEVLEYWTPDRVYTVLQRKLVIRNEPNPFNQIPFLSINYYDVLDSFYGIGIAKLIGGEQKLQQGVVNAYNDDLSLSLMGMWIRSRNGINAPAQNIRMRPGGVIDADNEKAIQLVNRPNSIGADALTAIAASDSRAQRRSAANEMAVQGNIPSEKSSITRTATGVNMLAGGTGAKLQMFVENLADQVFVPYLKAVHQMNGLYLQPSEIQRILSEELLKAYTADPIEMLNGNYDFSVLAAAKLQARRTMAQSLPLVYQFILTEPVLDALAMQGMKVDMLELVKMTFDVSGWPNRQNVIVPMSPQDQQRWMMQNPAVQQQQAAQQQQQNKLQVIEEDNIGRAGRDVIRTLLKKAEEPAVGLNPKQ